MKRLQTKTTKKRVKPPTEAQMHTLAKLTGLEFDGGAGETRLFTETIHTHSLQLTKREYLRMEREIKSYKRTGIGFEVYAWNDCSGYEYWTVNMEEDNYIQVTVHITNASRANPEQIKKETLLAYEFFNHRYGAE